MTDDYIEELIYEFTLILIKQDFADKEKGSPGYIKKIDMYKAIVKLLKRMKG